LHCGRIDDSCVILILDHADTGVIISCMLGVILLLSAYAAIGLFMSSLTGYQIVAAISTLVMLFRAGQRVVHYGRGLICKKSDLFSFYIGPYQSPAYRLIVTKTLYIL